MADLQNISEDTMQEFVKTQAYIDGVWVDALDGSSFVVLNPATGAKIGHVPNMGTVDAENAVMAAHKALPEWKRKTAKERANILKDWYALIVEHADALALLLTMEQGKPLAEAKGEILYGASFVEWFAEEAKRMYGDTIPTHKSDTRVVVTREAIGVVSAITPWNFPNAMITRKVAPALAAGCTVVLKPAEDTPLSALALAVLAHKAGIPAGVLNIVTCDRGNAAEIGRVLSTHPLIRKISFTGSTQIGKLLMKQSADTVKKVSMELGGNAPFIVFESADIDKAVEGAMVCKYRNAGQTCVCANRLYVQDTIYDSFIEKMAAKIRELKVGDGSDEGTQIGPLINGKAIDKVKSHVKDALDKGAKLVEGGATHEAGDLFFQPTLLSNMSADMFVSAEETFGPLAGVFKFSTEDEVIELANDTQYGLASYFYTRELGQAFRVAEALEYGMVAINEPVVSGEAVPFGGVKESGIGREGSKYGLEDFTELKYLLIGGL